MWKKNRIWIVGTFIYGVVHAVLMNVNPAEAIEKSAQIGTIILVAVLIPKNLTMWLDASSPVQPLLRKFIVWRRELGILSGIIFVFHALSASWKYGNFNLTYSGDRLILPGTIGLLVVLLLLATSSSYALKTLKKWWSPIQNTVWFAVPLLFLHSAIASLGYKGEYSKIGMIGFGGIVLFSIGELFLFVTKPERQVTNKWKHMKLIALGSLTALLLFFLYP